MDKAQMRKKLQLLKEKILTSAHITHNTQQYQVEQLNKNHQHLQTLLAQNLNQFKNRIQSVQEHYEERLKEFQSFLDEETVHPQSINITCLKNYLNKQKQALKNILQNEQINKKDDDRLHKLVKQRNLELILQDIRRKQLETEVKHLEEIMINSKVVLYEIPEEKMTDKEEQLLNDRIQILLEEVKRLCELEETCKGDNMEDMSKVSQSLKKQMLRLQTVEKYINQENLDFKNFVKWTKSFDSFTEDLPSYAKFSQDHKTTTTYQQFIQEDQFQAVFSLWNPSEGIISSRTQTNEEIGGQLKAVRQQVKRLQSQIS